MAAAMLLCSGLFDIHLAAARTQLATGSDNLFMVTVTGRAAIQHEEAVEEARNMALEDALYYAALEGGAQIRGYSAVDESTALSENFIIRPASRILDYTITNEMTDDTHYAVTIQAVIGDIADTGCQNRPQSHVTLFKPSYSMATDLPYWMSQLPEMLFHEIAAELDAEPRLIVRDARNTARSQATTADNHFNNYDYRQLTTGRVSMRDGDMAVESAVHFTAENKTSLLSKTDYLRIRIESTVSASQADVRPQTVSDSFKIKLGQKLPLYSLTALNQEQRADLLALIKDAAELHARKLGADILCQPLTATLELAEGKLQARLGSRQGLHNNLLAFTDSSEMNFRILRVNEVRENQSTLTPLDSRMDISDLAGARVKFLEFN